MKKLLFLTLIILCIILGCTTYTTDKDIRVANCLCEPHGGIEGIQGSASLSRVTIVVCKDGTNITNVASSKCFKDIFERKN